VLPTFAAPHRLTDRKSHQLGILRQQRRQKLGTGSENSPHQRATLGKTQKLLHARLVELRAVEWDDLSAVRKEAGRACLEAPAGRTRPEVTSLPEQWLVLVGCRDEQQEELLGRLSGEGWSAAPCCRRRAVSRREPDQGRAGILVDGVRPFR
jgi:hypothetical protein